MTKWNCTAGLVLALLLAPATAFGQPAAPLFHDVEVELDPAAGTLQVVDRISGGPREEWRFALTKDVAVTPAEAGEPAIDSVPFDAPRYGAGSGEMGEEVGVKEYRVAAPPNAAEIVVRYSGRIRHELTQESEEYARSFSRSAGLITEEGVVLAGSSWWLPTFGEELVTFRLTTIVPAGWSVVTQGDRTEFTELDDGRRRIVWECRDPMDQAYLIAAPFFEYSRPAGSVEAMAFLREADSTLANRYLEATAQYVEMYRKLIGPYPYGKFALVENFWETGYGMPSFTLLGSRVIRLPFILHSSYPHEILHNWWGNSVYVDYDSGNWCEGLTAYLADHLTREGRGQGAEYRRDQLASYRNYVQEGLDFPLSEFRSRHSSATQAVGYGKCLMLFHMLRKRVGDETFRRGLARFYRQKRYQRASFTDIEQVFSDTAGESLAPFFEQWVTRTGAPALSLGRVRVEEGIAGAPTAVFEVRQDADPPYELTVPVALWTRDGRLHTREVKCRDAVTEVSWPLDGSPSRLAIDPRFDVFRRLDTRETPPTLGQVFGAPKVLIVTPLKPRIDWTPLIEAWSGEGVEVVSEEEIEALPPDRAVWVLGVANRWGARIEGLLGGRARAISVDEVHLADERVPHADHSFIFAARHPSAPDSAVAWIGTTVPAAVTGLARKLPHYGRRSYLAFKGEEPTVVVKGSWSADGSPLVHSFSGIAIAKSEGFPEEVPLARLGAVFDADRLRGHVAELASDAMEGRGVGSASLLRAAEYIAAQFEAAGLEPAGDVDENGKRTFFQEWSEPGGPAGAAVTLKNVVAVLPGTRAEWREQSVVLGAHYDHLGRGWPDVRQGEEGKIHNGADDNASGVAVMLEVAALLASEGRPERSLVFVAFSGEEWGRKGSLRYVGREGPWPAEKARAMVNLDSVGRLDGREILVLGAGTATEWVHIARGVGFTTGVKSKVVAEDPGGSDQVSFHGVGVPAIQLFSGTHDDYHRSTDDVDKIDAGGMVSIATWVRETLGYLASRPEVLTSTLSTTAAGDAPTERPKSARRVLLGTRPDFAFPGEGVRVDGITGGSPAEKAGLAAGDILVALDDLPIRDLQGYSDALRRFSPGDRVTVHFRRGDEKKSVELVLEAR